jgi:hypothetical protein
MHKIERKTSGFLLTFADIIHAAEMRDWVAESRQALESENGAFCVIVDMRTLAPLTAEAQQAMVEGQKLYRERGMTRSSVIVNNAVTAIQFRRLAKQSGIYQWERYFDGTQPGCFEAAVAWGRDGVDPDVDGATQ